jgi:hypothetical protein
VVRFLDAIIAALNFHTSSKKIFMSKTVSDFLIERLHEWGVTEYMAIPVMVSMD